MKESIQVMISEEEVVKRITEVAEQINADYQGEPLKLICVLKGSVMFTSELAKHLTMPVYMDFMSASSYGNDTISSGMIKIKKDLDEPVEGENVLIVEDIIDSGRTLRHLAALLDSRGAKSVKICTLLNKPERRVVNVDVDYQGFEIPDAFVVGYGLDYAQKYRNLPYIGVISFEEE